MSMNSFPVNAEYNRTIAKMWDMVKAESAERGGIKEAEEYLRFTSDKYQELYHRALALSNFLIYGFRSVVVDKVMRGGDR